jgi:hypothetical protein
MDFIHLYEIEQRNLFAETLAVVLSGMGRRSGERQWK